MTRWVLLFLTCLCAFGDVTPAQYLQTQTPPVFNPVTKLPHSSHWGWPLSYGLIQELGTNWGYAMELNGYNHISVDLADTNSIPYKVLILASNNPTKLKLQVNLEGGATVDNSGAWPTNLSNGFWVTNSSGQFVQLDGSTFTPSSWIDSRKVVSPEAADSDLTNEANYITRYFTNGAVLANMPIAIVLNGGERDLGVYGQSSTAWSADPRTTAGRGSDSWPEYVSKKKAHQLGVIATAVRAGVPNREHYVWYKTQDSQLHITELTDWYNVWANWNWNDLYTVATNTPGIGVDAPGFESYYLGKSSYTNIGGAGNGYAYDLLTYYLNGVGYHSTVLGHTTNYSWISGGWGTDTNALSDPSRYKGFLKCQFLAGMVGAVAGDFAFPSGGFDAPFPTNSPPNWLQQKIVLARVRGTFSWLDNYIFAGAMLTGSVAHAMSTAQPSLEFTNTVNDPYCRVLARKLNAANNWLICAWKADGTNRDVTVNIPILGAVTVTASDVGTLYIATLSGMTKLPDDFVGQPTWRFGNWGSPYQGVPGGIPTNRTTLNLVTCATNGLSDAYTAIQTVANSTPSGQVIQLPAGKLLLNTTIALLPGQTLRGTGSGTNAGDTQIINNTGNYAIAAQTDSFPLPEVPPDVTGGIRGSTNVTLSDASGFSVGYFIDFRAYAARTNEHLTVYGPQDIVNVSGHVQDVILHKHGWGQMPKITAISGNNVTFWPPLVDNFTNGCKAMYYDSVYSSIGIEDLCVTFHAANGSLITSGSGAVYLDQNFGSWIQNVHVIDSPRRGFYLEKCLQFEIRHCFMDGVQNPGPNHESIDIASLDSGGLIEDNIGVRQFPFICLGDGDFGIMGNAVLFNYSTRSDSGSSQAGPDILTHGLGNEFNLIEGNICEKIMLDSYYGDATYNTIYRNWSSGNNPNTNLYQLRFALQLDAFSLNNTVGANVFGTNSPLPDLYEETGQSGNESAIRRVGYRNFGNNGYKLYYDPAVTTPNIMWPGPNRFGPTTATATATTNLQGNFVGIVAGVTVALQDSSNTNDYVYASVYANGTTTNLLLGSPVTRASGTYAYSFDATSDVNVSAYERNVDQVRTTLISSGNYDYKTGTTDSDGSWDTFPNSLFADYASTAPSWWPSTSLLRFPPVQPADTTKVTMNPAMARYLGITIGGSPTYIPSRSARRRF